MGRLAAAVAMLALAAGRTSAVQLDALESQREYRLAALRIVGADAVKPRDVRKVMLTRPRPWYTPWRAHPVFDPVTFRTDLERVRRLFESRGYYAARVVHDVELPATGDAVTAVVYVEEGTPVVVHALDVTLAGEPLTAAERDRLLGHLPLRRGAVFTEDAYDATLTTLRTYYREHGYARVAVARTAGIDVGAGTATITFHVTSGPASVFGETRITGTETVTRGVIRRELAYEPGDPFTQSRLDKTRDRLVGLNLFRAVRVDEEPGTDPRVDIHIHVAEAPPREVRVGVGYDTEEQVRGLASWRSYSFLGGARQLGFTARVSLIRRTLAADFLQPHFPGQANRTRLLFAEQQELEDTYDLDRTRLSPRFEWQATERITGFAFYRVEYDSLGNVRKGVRGVPGLAPPNSVLSGFGVGVDWNATDDLIDPTRGWVTSATVEPVGGPLGGDVSFVRAVTEARLYQPLVARLLGAARIRIGAAEPTYGSPEIPLFERFYAGGIDSVRGYGRRRIGPLDQHDEPLGGRTLTEASTELRHPITDRIAGAVFLDGGAVSPTSFTFPIGHLRYGTGLGAIVRSPIGPLRLDVGFPLHPPDDDQRWQVHVSLGASF